MTINLTRSYGGRYPLIYRYLVLLCCLCLLSPAVAQDSVMTDTNTPLHLLEPDYPHPYGRTTIQGIKAHLDRVFGYLDEVTPAAIIDKYNGKALSANNPGPSPIFAPGQFRLTSYEWGVTYAAMLAVYDKTADIQYEQYAGQRVELLRDLFAYYREKGYESWVDAPIRSMLEPHALDDAGALCMAMIKYSLATRDTSLRPVIDHFIDFILHKEYRLPDGTFARNRPLKNTVWLDDLFMSVPALAYMGKLTGDETYFDEAARQVIQIAERMFDHDKRIFIHGWIANAEIQPKYHWARANGWAIMAITELLDVLPSDHKDRQEIMNYYKAHVAGLAALQSGKGFWHQLLDRNDSYLETSSTAIFTYAIAKGINKGWLAYDAFGPMVLLAWEALSTQINDKGQITGTCVGTGMGFDPAFYYYRPVNVFAAHSYGPVLLAGAEMIDLLGRWSYEIDETAVQFKTDK